ncbi:MAG: phosphatidylserine decarboxylase [Gemmatimonadota bacterium]
MTKVAALLLIALISAFVWWRFYFFHRNPARRSPPGNDPVCAADGRIVYIEPVVLPDGANAYHQRVGAVFDLAGPWTVIATYLGIFDVHVVRAPMAGRVRLHRIEPIGDNTSMGRSFIYAALRRPLPAGQRAYLDKNEFLGVDIEGDGRILLVLMADWWIDQITPLVEDGAWIERGQAIGKILMGSQVDVWVPEGSIKPAPVTGDRVRAGEMVLGVRPRQR